ncbi:MAG: TolC family protein [Acidobacteria bacterium]|nr:TolC family protein [Acidobacteriota bacterium]
MITAPLRSFRFVLSLAAALAWLAPDAPVAAQSRSSAPRSVTLAEVMEMAREHYPAVHAATARVEASASGVSAARAAWLPRLDGVWQVNRGTANNTFGQVLPQSVMPSMSGPVLGSTSNGSVWGTAAGALLSWDAFDFGVRHAALQQAERTVDLRQSEQSLTLLSVQASVASAFLGAAAAEQAVTASEADLQRREVLARTTHVLVDNQLRPGADASRADAERAAAEIRLIQARQALTVARIGLTRLLGGSGAPVTPDTAALLDDARASQVDAPPGDLPLHPAVAARRASVSLARASEEVQRSADRPRILLQSALFGRGSGANPDGRLDGTGLWFERANWVTGIQFVVPNLFDRPALHARVAGSAALRRAEEARAAETALAVTAEQQTAQAMVDTARAVAAQTPVQLAAAQQGEAQARARYDAGLAAITEVAEAQALLARAEYDDRLARVEVWRALLARAAAQGDLAPFIERARTAGGR